MITIFSRPSCQPCKATKRLLQSRGIEFLEVPADSPEGEAYLRGSPCRTLPVVDTGEEVWEGFRPDKIKAIPVPPAPHLA